MYIYYNTYKCFVRSSVSTYPLHYILCSGIFSWGLVFVLWLIFDFRGTKFRFLIDIAQTSPMTIKYSRVKYSLNGFVDCIIKNTEIRSCANIPLYSKELGNHSDLTHRIITYRKLTWKTLLKCVLRLRTHTFCKSKHIYHILYIVARVYSILIILHHWGDCILMVDFWLVHYGSEVLHIIYHVYTWY